MVEHLIILFNFNPYFSFKSECLLYKIQYSLDIPCLKLTGKRKMDGIEARYIIGDHCTTLSVKLSLYLLHLQFQCLLLFILNFSCLKHLIYFSHSITCIKLSAPVSREGRENPMKEVLSKTSVCHQYTCPIRVHLANVKYYKGPIPRIQCSVNIGMGRAVLTKINN